MNIEFSHNVKVMVSNMVIIDSNRKLKFSYRFEYLYRNRSKNWGIRIFIYHIFSFFSSLSSILLDTKLAAAQDGWSIHPYSHCFWKTHLVNLNGYGHSWEDNSSAGDWIKEKANIHILNLDLITEFELSDWLRLRTEMSSSTRNHGIGA